MSEVIALVGAAVISALASLFATWFSTYFMERRGRRANLANSRIRKNVPIFTPWNAVERIPIREIRMVMPIQDHPNFRLVVASIAGLARTNSDQTIQVILADDDDVTGRIARRDQEMWFEADILPQLIQIARLPNKEIRIGHRQLPECVTLVNNTFLILTSPYAGTDPVGSGYLISDRNHTSFLYYENLFERLWQESKSVLNL